MVSDYKGCDTVYCGWDSSCKDESLLEQAALACESEENQMSVRYSEGSCSQVKCSKCLSEEELSAKGNECLENGLKPVRETDSGTNCPIVYCEEGENSSLITGNVVEETGSKRDSFFMRILRKIFG